MVQRTVLIADDDRRFRRILHDLASNADGYVVVGEAENGEQALELIESVRPQLVLIDLELPDMDAFRVMELARGDASEPVFIVISLYDDRHLVGRAFDLGAVAYLRTDDVEIRLPECLGILSVTLGAVT